MSANMNDASAMDPRPEPLIDYLIGDLAPTEVMRLEQRLESDSLLRLELYEQQRMIEAMRSCSPAVPRPDFVASVMAAIHSDLPCSAPAQARIRSGAPAWRRSMALVSVVILAAAGFLLLHPIFRSSVPGAIVFSPRVIDPPASALVASLDPVIETFVQPMEIAVQPVAAVSSPEPVAARPVPPAIAGLIEAQLPDGSWESEPGSRSSAKPGLTALVLCSLMQTYGEDCFSGDAGETARRALDYLVGFASDSGGGQRVMFAHQQQMGFVAVALSEARRLHPDGEDAVRIDKALAALSLPGERGELRIASCILPNLPEQAVQFGGHVYRIARELLIIRPS